MINYAKCEVFILKKIFVLIFCIILMLSLPSCNNQGENDDIKYVFLFVGDGMGANQVLLAEYAGKDLAFREFDSFGSVTTHNLSSEITDSASAATAFSTGKKTLEKRVGIDKWGKELYNLTDFFKDKGMKVGLVSSQGVNHATPAAFYAHNESRYNYYEIGLDFINSDIDLFAGGGFIEPDGEKGNLYDLAKDKAITNNEVALPFEIDRQKGEKSLADYLSLTIDALDGDEGFFVMCEGGRIDSACHANDAATLIHEVTALDDAVKVALDFYKKNPDNTLIIVTADHETGGLSLGYTSTEYEMYPKLLLKQKLSYSAFEGEYIPIYIENDSSLDEIIEDIEELFCVSDLTELEKARLFYAWELTKKGSASYTASDWVEFSDKIPLTVAITNIVSSRAGVDFTTFYHTASPVGLWAKGVGEESFMGFYDNTDIYKKIVKACS